MSFAQLLVQIITTSQSYFLRFCAYVNFCKFLLVYFVADRLRQYRLMVQGHLTGSLDHPNARHDPCLLG